MAIHVRRARWTAAACALAVLAALSAPFTQTALAGTVSLQVEGEGNDQVVFVADPGEANRVVITLSTEPPGLVVADAGALVVAGAFCTPLDSRTVRCDRRPGGNLSVYPDVRLGDLDDELSSRSGFGFQGYGGPGDDRLIGSPASDLLDGGGGRDELRGGGAQDFLTDGDRDGLAGDGAPGPDILDGGGGLADTVSYAQRSDTVNIDLEHPAGDGAIGEGDTIVDVEHIVGGSGEDRLAGDGRRNLLQGGGGADRLIGRGRNDAFYGTLTFTQPTFAPDEGPDSFSCGPGRDLILPVEADDFVRPDCETVGSDDGRLSYVFRPYPSRTQGATAIFRIGCPFDIENLEDERPTRCHGRIMITEAARRRRLLGRGEIASGRDERAVHVALTDAGERLAKRRRGVLAVIRVRGRNLGPTAWTIRLKLSG